MGTRRALARWKHYKRRTALALVARGYSVEWYPDGTNRIDVYVPERLNAGTPEVRARVQFYMEPSRFGINGGRISRLRILELNSSAIERSTRAETVFCYDRNGQFDHLFEHPVALELYRTVVDVLDAPTTTVSANATRAAREHPGSQRT